MNRTLRNIIVDFMIYICKFEIVFNNKKYTQIHAKDGKYFFIFTGGKIKYGYSEDNAKDYTEYYSVKLMKQRLIEEGYYYEILQLFVNSCN